MRDILLRELPGTTISISSDIMPEIFEHERFSTTVANTVLAPVTGDYTRDLAKRLADGGYKEDLLLLHSGGGVMTAKTSEKFSARLAASGIAAGAIASRFVAQLSGFENSIGFDMGGTSTDVCLCDQRRPAGHQGLACRVRLSDLLPEHRGADNRRRWRIARLDRQGRITSQRTAIGRLTPGSGLLQPRRH